MEAVKVEQWLLNDEVIFVSHFLVINGARECQDLQTDRQTSPLLIVAGKHFVLKESGSATHYATPGSRPWHQGKKYSINSAMSALEVARKHLKEEK